MDLKNKKSCYKNVQDAVSYKGLVEDALFKMKDYLTTTEKRQNGKLGEVNVYYSWLEALTINHISQDLDKDYEDIKSKIKLNEKDGVLQTAEDVMALVAAGYKVKDYNGKNYGQQLLDYMNEDGAFAEVGKKVNIYEQAYSIIALDIAQSEYDSEKAVNKLVSLASSGYFYSVEETAWALIALSNYKNIEGVQALIDSSIEYLKNEQSKSGGFDMFECGDTPQYTALVIQALIANGMDPLAKEWTKENGDLVSSILNDQLEDGTFRSCETMGNYVDLPSTERAFAALAELYKGKSIYEEVEPVLDENDVVKKLIRDVSKYYDNEDKYSYIQAMALNIAGMNLAEISSRLEMRKAEADRTHVVWDNATEMQAKDIMAIIAAGKNPRDYEGENYVDILVDAQNEKGIFEVDGTSVSSQAYSIIALDMADAKYDLEKAINILVTNYEDKKKASVYTTSSVLIALSNHREIDGIDEKIDQCIEDLKEMQISTGGFDYNKGSSWDDPHEVSEYDAIAIQALIAVGKNPLSEEFQKNGKTVLDALMEFKKDNHFVYDTQKSSYTEYTNQATGMVFAALVDLDKKESMYHSLAIKYEENDIIKPIITTNLENKIVKEQELVFTATAKDDKDGSIVVVVKLGDIVISSEQDGSYKVNLVEGENTITITAVDTAGNETIETFKINCVVDKTPLREKIEKAIDSSSNIFIGQETWNSWQIIGIARAGKSVPTEFIDSINVNDLVKATDYERTILGVLAAGGDPMDVDGVDLIEKLCAMDLPSKSINGIVYGLIALDAGKYKLPKDINWTRENLIESLVSKQNKDGGWSFFGEISDPDMTGMVMTALAPYNNEEHVNVQEAINKAVERLASTQVSDGEHKGAFDIQGEYPTAANGNSTAQVLMGLSSNGIDPKGEKFTKNGKNVVDALLSFQSENGGFGYTDNEYNGFVTEQALYALEQYIYYLDGKGLIFSWGDKNPIEELIIENLTGVDNFKLGKDAKITIQATNKKNKEQNIVLIVALFNEEGKFITYNAMEYIIESGKSVKLKTMMKLPESGEYNIKCLIWDSFDGMNELSESIKLQVTQ